MKVCVATTAFPRWEGDGEGVFIWEAVRAIAKRDIQVTVVAMHVPGTPSIEKREGITILRPPYWYPPQHELLRKDPGGLPITWRRYRLTRLQLPLFLLRHSMAITKVARTSDIIHAHWTLSASAALIGQWHHQKPVLTTVQGSDIFQIPRLPLGRWFTKRTLTRSRHITALSNALKEQVLHLGINDNKITIIPNGVDTSTFTPLPSRQREDIILFVGSLIQRKGANFLLEAMASIAHNFPHYRLVLIGDGPQKTSLQQLAKRLGIDQRVTFTGRLPQHQVKKWMQRAKVFVLPSVEEGMGVVLIEALASGTPVVASNVGGIPDVITSDVGILVPPKDVQALANALRDILRDPSHWDMMSHRARRRAVEIYDWGQVSQRFVSLYHSILDNAR